MVLEAARIRPVSTDAPDPLMFHLLGAVGIPCDAAFFSRTRLKRGLARSFLSSEILRTA